MNPIKNLSRLVLAGTVAVSGMVAAQENISGYPERPVTWIVPFDAGGGADTWTRIIASEAESVWGESFIVQNQPGQGGVRGWQSVLGEPNDGYTIIHASPTPIITLLSQENPPIEPSDIRIVGFLGSYENVIASKPADPWATWDELVSYAKENPGQLTIGGTNAPLLAAAFLFDQAGVDATFIPYSGSGAATTDFLGGHIDLLVTTTTSGVALLPNEATLVVNTSDEQLPQNTVDQINDMGASVPPTATDLGFEGFSYPRWVGVQPQTPDELIIEISRLLEELMSNDVVKDKIAKAGEEVNYIGYEEAQTRYDRLVEDLKTSVQLLQ
ncbi:Bug family tripartite tricarboxylate transporter substrate binding protein [Halomonas sp. HMF6819]|uniref:Bug family tripartite tricarboxylate transporter substrate binding protein n=1 Tax=Halomonas sp. HMF6819 TaxID=3373085 RepID=UPI00379BD67A